MADKYVKLSQREHVLKRPDMYIGSIEAQDYNTWVFDEDKEIMEKSNLQFVPGLYKIFDEVLVNAIDHSIRLKISKSKNLTKNIKINIDKSTGVISVFNDGDGIDIVKHPEHDLYIPELIFGNLLTSSNYNDKEEKIIGGKFGIGAKATNIFSKKFIIETVDDKTGKLYYQEFHENMTKKTKPKIKASKKYPYTKITFLPDYEKFGLKNLTDDIYKVLSKRAYDTCALTDTTINVYLNNKKLEYKSFEKYINAYTDNVAIYEKCNERWEVAVVKSNEGFEDMSFVNGIWTIRGGKHVDYITNQIIKNLIETIKKKRKIDVKSSHIKDSLFVFIKSTIVDPSFDSQTKETLTTLPSKFGSKCELSSKFMDKIYKSDIIENAIELSGIQNNKEQKKTDGKKRNILRGIPKLDDANWAGTQKGHLCTLILTEGDSAKTMAIAGLSEVGRDKYGVFPLRGKLMNVKDTTVQKINANEEITNLKKILGLESGKKYESLKDLRYGRIMIMCDADVDGTHIKGLLINMFHSLWPSLLEQPEFITSMLTPVVKAKNSKGNTIEFYNMTDYENWKQKTSVKGWDIKYYKGLGTSTTKEAKEYFKDIQMVKYKWTNDGSAIDLAFNKKKTDPRKKWLGKYDRKDVIDYKEREVTFTDFINRDLIHFSNYDLERSIPSLCDGLKPSHRKTLFAAFKKNLTKEIKVAQFSGYVSEHASYHHGEASLQGAIITMAQNFVGSNNINLLQPEGQFGSRILGGKDAASPRYIFTRLTEITNIIFNKYDNYVLEYLTEEGQQIEPLFYIPIIPMILVNGALGIGTGFSTKIPCYNPLQIVDNIKLLIRGNRMELPDLEPWYDGFKGSIESSSSRGLYKRISDNTVEVTELPVGVWTDDYKEFLESYIEKHPKVLKNYESHYTDKVVRFKLIFDKKELDDLMKNPKHFEEELKLVSKKSLSTSNMHLYNKDGQIRKYETPNEIIKEFYKVRIEYYQKRKDFLVDQLDKEIINLDARIKYILGVIEKKIKLLDTPLKELESQLTEMKFPKIEGSYNYLIDMPGRNFTHEKKEELLKKLNDKKLLMEEIKNKEVETMYMEDLNKFVEAYKQFLTEKHSV